MMTEVYLVISTYPKPMSSYRKHKLKKFQFLRNFSSVKFFFRDGCGVLAKHEFDNAAKLQRRICFLGHFCRDNLENFQKEWDKSYFSQEDQVKLKFFYPLLFLADNHLDFNPPDGIKVKFFQTMK